MLTNPNCYKRKCMHFDGVKQDGDLESTERPVCAAFLNGIPEVIAYGSNLHFKPFPGDGGITFEKARA